MHKLLILSYTPSDLSDLLLQSCPGASFVSFAESKDLCLQDWDALAVLGGCGETGCILPASIREQAENMANAGKPVFCEFCMSFGCFYAGEPEPMSHHRLVVRNAPDRPAALEVGDILDGHMNDCLSYYFCPEDRPAVLTYHNYLCAHDHIDVDGLAEERRALFYAADNLLICAFRLCNFHRARLAPAARWQALITSVVSFLAGESVSPVYPEPVCTFRKEAVIETAEQIQETVPRGLGWYHNADMLVDEGRSGVREGLSHHIRAADGKQLRARQIRTDCSGETGGAFLFDWMCTGNPDSLRIFRNTEDFIFRYMQIRDGLHRGMMRWSETAWMTCYQDDAARAILPTLFCQNFTEEGSRHFADAVEACTYMVNTTGLNGLRAARTDCGGLTESGMHDLRTTNSGTSSAHYNAYYHAALLLCCRGGGPEVFLKTAEAGLRSIMAVYPENTRETSETEEMCRLIFPLAVLYEITKNPEHRTWLYRVTEDLEKVHHPSGGYLEWDTGYKANCSRREAGECALLAENGDPVVDLLYSVNWLPLGFAYAYLATGDTMFRDKWVETAGFLTACQIHSDDLSIHGSWTRAFDVSRWEIYGVPHDVGWAPCCVETGWTVAEILMGLQFMQIAETRIPECTLTK